MKLVPVFDPANNQSGPQYGLEVHGLVHRVTYQRADPAGIGRQLSEGDAPFARTFALLRQDGKYLIAADYPPAK